jgi:hypothetical protein
MKTDQVERQLGLLLGAYVLFCYTCPGPAASGDESWDSEIGSPGVEGYGVSAIAVGDDGVYIGGTFWRVGRVAITNLARWNGRQWFGVGGGVGKGASQGVRALLCVRSSVYVGGTFKNVGDVPATNVAQWDGTQWFPLGSGIVGVVTAMATDGSNVFVGGSFTNAGGITATNIARWDGKQWWPLGNGVRGEVGGIGAVDAIAVARDGVYVGGAFTNAGPVAARNIARWDGTSWFALGPGLAGRVYKVACFNSDIYAGGAPFRTETETAVYLSKWNGPEWVPVGVAAWPAGGGVQALAVCGSDLYVGGSFVWMNGLLASGIAKWDDRNWATLGSGFTQGGALWLACTGTELFVGGRFATAGGHPSTNIALWHIPHSVTIKPTGSAVRLSWPATGTNFLLEAREDLQDGIWAEVSEPPVVDKDECVVTNEMSSPSAFYRLRRKPW